MKMNAIPSASIQPIRISWSPSLPASWRIVSWVTLGDELQHGQLYGMIKFGSCAEIYVRDNVEITVKKGDKVRGGESVIGRIVQ